MQFIMDMVHDNPGEARCKTAFRSPEKLIGYGFNTQVFKHNDTTMTFDKLGDFFTQPGAREWLSEAVKISDNEIFPAHEKGLMTMCHMDLFVLPTLLIQKYKNEICGEDGKISIFKEKTKELHRILFDELFEKYPLDGIIIRVGETYLHDTPFHSGNGAVKYGDIEEEKKTFIELIKFLKAEVCEKHNKYLIFRTWDCFPDRFHADKQYYLDVTNNIEPDDKLIFSIKHTALDFWRRVKFNPCLGEGKHKQVIEVQCQREYEGKGSYPMYVMDGVINGFPELSRKQGIKDISDNPLICGIYSWSRGGGWFGPYIKNEFWCDLNSYIISHFAAKPQLTEHEIFIDYAMNVMGLDESNAEKFHDMCLRIPDAVLKGRYIEAYDKSLNESIMPCGNWIRDDRIGGLRQLNDVFEYLEKNNSVQDAVEEKHEAVRIWEQIKKQFSDIEIKDKKLSDFISESIEYGLRFYRIIDISFNIFAKCRKSENVRELLEKYDAAWADYKKLEENEQASSSYCEEYIFSENNLGLNETIDYCRKNLC